MADTDEAKTDEKDLVVAPIETKGEEVVQEIEAKKQEDEVETKEDEAAAIPKNADEILAISTEVLTPTDGETNPPPEDIVATAEDIARREYASTSIIESFTIEVTIESHLQLERPGIKSKTRKPKTNLTKTFSQLLEEQKQREEDAKKPKENVDQEWDDPFDLLAEVRQQKSKKSMAEEALGIQAMFAQKAKERKEKEAKGANIIEEERPASIRAASSGKKRMASDGKVDVEVDADEKSPTKIKLALCCTIS